MISLSRLGSPRRTAPHLYASVVAAARAPLLYGAFGVPDTIEGRYEMIVLHMTLLQRRLRAPGVRQKPLAQALIDFMAADFDRSMRELGVGDLSVGRYMKRLGEGLYGRAAAYDQALDDANADALAHALLRNVYDGGDPGGGRLAQIADYVRRQADCLASQPIEAIAAGCINFCDVEDEDIGRAAST